MEKEKLYEMTSELQGLIDVAKLIQEVLDNASRKHEFIKKAKDLPAMVKLTSNEIHWSVENSANVLKDVIVKAEKLTTILYEESCKK